MDIKLILSERRKQEIQDYLRTEGERRRKSISRGEYFEIGDYTSDSKSFADSTQKCDKPSVKREEKRTVSTPKVRRKRSKSGYERRLFEISQPKTSKIQEREKQKRRLEQEDFDQHCTFRPKITQVKDRPEEPIEERLQRLGKEHRDKYEFCLLYTSDAADE